MGRIERGCGDDGEPVQSPLGQHELSLAVWLRLVSRKVCGRAGRALLRSWHAPSIGRFVWGGDIPIGRHRSHRHRLNPACDSRSDAVC